MLLLSKMFKDSGFLSWFLTTPRRTRRRRAPRIQSWLSLGRATSSGARMTMWRRSISLRASSTESPLNRWRCRMALMEMTFLQVYTKTFKCTYQLQLYPFDTQVSKCWRGVTTRMATPKKLQKSAVQQSFVDLLPSSVFTFRSFVCLHGNISIYLHRMMF